MANMYLSDRRTAGRVQERGRGETARPGPDIGALAAGAAPTPEQMGSRVDLPEGIREKMESSFGADFSNVKLYESQTVADAGAQAVTQGTNIAFAPGKLDLTSTSGQALLGHELSHVVSQARGESAGRGFLNDAGLESQADRQGMLAAQGESAYAGPVSPISVGSASAASGPMQAKKQSTIDAEEEAKLSGQSLPGYFHPIQRSRTKNALLQKRQERLGKMNNYMLGAAEAKNITNQTTRSSAQMFQAYAERYLDSLQFENKDARDDAKKQLMTHMGSNGSMRRRFLTDRLPTLESDEERDKMFRDFAVEDKSAIGGHLSNAMDMLMDNKTFDYDALTGKKGEGEALMSMARSSNAMNINTVMGDLLTPSHGYISGDSNETPLSQEKVDQFNQFARGMDNMFNDLSNMSLAASVNGNEQYLPATYKLGDIRDRQKRRRETDRSQWGDIHGALLS